MIEVSRLTLLVLGELLIGFALLSTVLVTLLVIRKGKIRKAAKHLVERIQSDKASRTERLRDRLSEKYQYEGEKLEQGLHDLTQAEMRLYQNIINSYLKQDVVEFQQTDVDVENLVLAYQGLELPSTDAALSSGEVNADESTEIQRLNEENERLSEELRVTMDTMGRMLNEYSSMFAGGADNQVDKSQLKGMFESKGEISEEAESNDKPASNMTETDIDDLVAPMSQIDDVELIEDSDEPAPATPEIGLDKPQDPEQIAEQDADLVVIEEFESEPAAIANSLMDDLEKVDIEIPDVDEIGDEALAEPELLEDEWAKLLAEDAESTEGEMEAEVNHKQG